MEEEKFGQMTKVRIPHHLTNKGQEWSSLREKLVQLHAAAGSKYNEWGPLVRYLENMALLAKYNPQAKNISADFADLTAMKEYS